MIQDIVRTGVVRVLGANDFERFFRYLVMAWEEIQPGIIESPLGTLIDSSSPDKEALLAAFINVRFCEYNIKADGFNFVVVK